MRHGGHLPLGIPPTINSIEWWLTFQADDHRAAPSSWSTQLVTGSNCASRTCTWSPTASTRRCGRRPRPPSTGREPLVVAWGRVQYEKGFQVLARAIDIARGRVPRHPLRDRRARQLPAELQSQIDVEGVSDIVDLPGFVPDDELRAIAHRAGCVVIPSLYEPFGIVALEALAAGAPLIVARTGGLAEILEGTDAGLLFEPGNHEDLARCIIAILTDDELAARLTTNGRALVEQTYTWDAIAAATAEVYDRLLCQHGRLRIGTLAADAPPA